MKITFVGEDKPLPSNSRRFQFQESEVLRKILVHFLTLGEDRQPSQIEHFVFLRLKKNESGMPYLLRFPISIIFFQLFYVSPRPIESRINKQHPPSREDQIHQHKAPPLHLSCKSCSYLETVTENMQPWS